MSFQQIAQPFPSITELEFAGTPQPLWKRITSKINYEEFQTTQQSSNSSGRSPARMNSQDKNSGANNQPNINQFLLTLHHRISDSVIGSESEVMEKISLDWGEQSRIRPPLSNITKSFSINEASSLIQTPRTERVICTQMLALRELTNVDDFLNFIADINPKIHKEVSSLIDDNIRLNQECNTLKYKQKKTDVKAKMLTNQIEVLEKKNSKLIQDFEKLKKEVDLQIQIEEDKLKYEYEIKIQELKEQFEKRENNADSSTKCSNSNYFAPMKQSTEGSEISQKNAIQVSLKQQIQETEEKTRGQFARTNKRNVNFSVGANQKELPKAPSKDSSKPTINCYIDQMMQQIIKPSKKENRSLKLHSTTPRQI